MNRIITGRVSSNTADKTIVVTVSFRNVHPLYKKQYTRHRKFMAHDSGNEARIGDLVSIRESRPISARKRFTLDKILERAEAGFEEKIAMADVPIKELEKKEKPAVPKKSAAKPNQEENK